ncbi:MAG: serine hydrolase, partial [bacterium]|nr:serine hydrolase [bacterium]
MRPFLAVLALGLSAVLPAGVPEGSIEGFVDIEMPASGVPGLAYAVVADGEITAVGAHGVVEIGGVGEVMLDTP